MSNHWKNIVRPLGGYTFAQKSALFMIADLARDDGVAFVYMDRLAAYMCCHVRTAQHAVRELEKRKDLVSLRDKAGRGQPQIFRINIESPTVKQPPVESSPVVPPEHIPPPTNGHAPVTPPPRDPYKPDPLSDEEVKARHAQWAAKRAEMAAKPRPEKKHERPGRTARESARLVSGQSPVGGDTGGDAAP